jgi:hypothetical protein
MRSTWRAIAALVALLVGLAAGAGYRLYLHFSHYM